VEHDEVRNLSEALAALGESISHFQDNVDNVDASLAGPTLKKGRRLLQEAGQFAVDLDATLREIRFLQPPPAKVSAELRRIASGIDASRNPDARVVRRRLEDLLSLLG
jgi:hypothetical protein